MILSDKTQEKLRNLINEETEYRSGPKIVEFFNQLGFNDVYKQGFPSRWIYTDDKLSKINGTPELDKCIKKIFSPINFVNDYIRLDKLISDFNQYLAFDGWNVIRKNTEISFTKAKANIPETDQNVEIPEDIFIKKEFEDVIPNNLFSYNILDVIISRINEIKLCLQAKAPLAVIFLCGSTLEGILLDIASNNPAQFNKANVSPKLEGKTKQFHDWTLANFIEVAYELGYLQEDVKKFSHILREFRNYIHPYQQKSSNFNPNEHTAKICFQVLKAAIYQINSKIKQR